MTLTWGTNGYVTQLDRSGATFATTIRGTQNAPTGVEDAVTAKALAESESDATLANFGRTNVSVTLNESAALVLYDVTVTYGFPPGRNGVQGLEVNEERERWSSTQETTRLTQSLSTVDFEPSGAPDYDGMIDVDSEGKARGIDVPVPKASFTVETRKSAASADSTYRKAVALMIGTVNSAAFRGWDAGELRLADVGMTQREDGAWDLSFTFEAQPNEEDVAIGDLTLAAVDGWDAVWRREVPEPDDANNDVKAKVDAVYVERVSPRTDFSVLGISSSAP